MAARALVSGVAAAEALPVEVAPVSPSRGRNLSRILGGLILPVILALVWEITVRAGLVEGRLVPPPSRIAAALQGLAATGELWLHGLATMTRVAIDVSGRPYLVWDVTFTRPKLGEMDTELFREWFQAFAQNAGITLHVANLYGDNNHHIAETCYKGLARALRDAIAIDPRQEQRVPSTKGTLSV